MSLFAPRPTGIRLVLAVLYIMFLYPPQFVWWGTLRLFEIPGKSTIAPGAEDVPLMWCIFRSWFGQSVAAPLAFGIIFYATLVLWALGVL